MGLGATVYLGYTDYVGTSFAFNHGMPMANHLIAGRTVGSIPGIGDTETDSHPAMFTSMLGANAAAQTLSTQSSIALKDYDLLIEYSWPQNVADL